MNTAKFLSLAIAAWGSLIALTVASQAQDSGEVKVIGNSGCPMILQQNRIKQSSNLTYAYNLMAAAKDSQEKKDIFVAITESAFALDFSSSANEVSSRLDQNMSYSESYEYAAQWLSPEQLTAYVACIEKETKNFVATVQSFDDDNVIIKVVYHPGNTAPTPMPFRSKVVLQGVDNFDDTMKSLPEELKVNEELAIPFKRKANQPFVMIVNAEKPIIVKIPSLPKFPCVAVNQSGHCTSMLVIHRFNGLSNNSRGNHALTGKILPTKWDWKYASITMTAQGTWKRTTGGGAGRATVKPYVIKDSGEEYLFPDVGGYDMAFGTAEVNGPVGVTKSYVYQRSDQGFSEIGLESTVCQAYAGASFNDPPVAPDNCSCDFDAALLINLN